MKRWGGGNQPLWRGKPLSTLIGIGVLALYFALQIWILPRLGIPT